MAGVAVGVALGAAFYQPPFAQCVAMADQLGLLGIGAVPAILYFVFLFIVPESPRWLVMRKRDEEAEKITTVQLAIDFAKSKQG